MLPRSNRVLTGAEFRQAFKSPVRVHTNWASLHLVPLDTDRATKVGFVVSKQVGNAVLRNRAKRRLRAISRELIATHPTGAMLAIRVKSEIHSTNHAELEAQFLDAVDRLFAKMNSLTTSRDVSE